MALTHDIHRAGAIAGDSRSGPPVMEPNRHVARDGAFRPRPAATAGSPPRRAAPTWDRARGAQRLQGTLVAPPEPVRQMRRARPFAAEEWARLTALGAGVSLPQDPQPVLGREATPRGNPHHLGFGGHFPGRRGRQGRARCDGHPRGACDPRHRAAPRPGRRVTWPVAASLGAPGASGRRGGGHVVSSPPPARQ